MTRAKVKNTSVSDGRVRLFSDDATGPWDLLCYLQNLQIIFKIQMLRTFHFSLPPSRQDPAMYDFSFAFVFPAYFKRRTIVLAY